MVVSVLPAPAGGQVVEVRYSCDINGALEVEIMALATGRSSQQVFRNQNNLSEQELKERFAARAEIRLPPREQARNRALVARRTSLCRILRGNTGAYPVGTVAL